MSSPVRITAAQRSFLEDRLELPCALAEALAEEFTERQVFHASRALLVMTNASYIGSDLTPVERAVLTDAIEGSTVLARMKEAGLPQLGSTTHMVRRLIRTLKAVGIDADMPSSD